MVNDTGYWAQKVNSTELSELTRFTNVMPAHEWNERDKDPELEWIGPGIQWRMEAICVDLVLEQETQLQTARGLDKTTERNEVIQPEQAGERRRMSHARSSGPSRDLRFCNSCMRIQNSTTEEV
jgi:hypothetical protein